MGGVHTKKRVKELNKKPSAKWGMAARYHLSFGNGQNYAAGRSFEVCVRRHFTTDPTATANVR